MKKAEEFMPKDFKKESKPVEASADPGYDEDNMYGDAV
jgi:hypothetical protein